LGFTGADVLEGEEIQLLMRGVEKDQELAKRIAEFAYAIVLAH
jgi:hypothetical protein